MVQSNTAVHIIINLAVCLISIGTAVILIWKCGQKKTKISKHDEDENELHQTEMEEKLQRECEEKKRLEDELQNKEEDLKHVRQTIEKLMEQKTSLKNQRTNLNTLLQEDKAEMKVVTKKEKENPLLDKEKKMQKLVDKKTDLEKRTEAHEELICADGHLACGAAVDVSIIFEEICYVGKRGHEKKRRTEDEAEEKEKEQLLAENKKSEELQQKEEELKDLEELVNILIDQENELNKLKNELKQQRDVVDGEVEDIENKLHGGGEFSYGEEALLSCRLNGATERLAAATYSSGTSSFGPK
nr:PREDICTED: putative golgin subfamily A member 6-like protein 3 [Pundamilia nyererei]